jgi:hypothetical protein
LKDKYPAYVSWETFEKIQATLRDNRADYLRVKGRGVPRDGAALLHGIAWCGECGHKMVVRYKGGSQYVCHHLRQQHDVPVCQCLRAAPIDSQVAAAFLEAVRELAARLRVPTKWIYTQLRRGSILTTLDPAGRYLFPDDEAAMQAIRALRVHSINRVDLREHQHQKEG